MIRLSPSSTLFPYTTLFRSHSRGRAPARPIRHRHRHVRLDARVHADPSAARAAAEVQREHERSEEHTSELQSLRHLVCRLLLEKKKEEEFRTVTTNKRAVSS